LQTDNAPAFVVAFVLTHYQHATDGQTEIIHNNIALCMQRHADV